MAQSQPVDLKHAQSWVEQPMLCSWLPHCQVFQQPHQVALSQIRSCLQNLLLLEAPTQCPRIWKWLFKIASEGLNQIQMLELEAKQLKTQRCWILVNVINDQYNLPSVVWIVFKNQTTLAKLSGLKNAGRETKRPSWWLPAFLVCKCLFYHNSKPSTPTSV